MSILYVNENGCSIGIEENRCTVSYPDGMKRLVPIESLEGIVILGRAQMTTQCTMECLKRGISVAYFSAGGTYFGCMESTKHFNAERQRRQCALYDAPFAVELSKKIVTAKLKNQSVVLRRYEKSKGLNLTECQKMLRICAGKIETCCSISEIMGYEGQGAKSYFTGLSMCVEKEFRFNGRNRRPPLDEFNSMLSLGYSILMNEIYCKIELHGLNPYFGFMHRDHEKHPTLASDLMEEWRAVIVDSTVMSMINGHEILKDDFYYDVDKPGCFITRNGLKKYLNKLERKLQTRVRYLTYYDHEVSFRYAMDLQIGQLIKAIEEEDASIYEPIRIR